MRYLFTGALLLMYCTLLFAQVPSENKNVVIYNQNIGVVKDARTLDIKKGTHLYSITDVPEKIDPTSIKIKIDAEVIEQNFKYDLASVSKVLEKYLNREIKLSGKSELFGKLISISDTSLVIENKQGNLDIVSMDEYIINTDELPEGLVTKPTIEWTIKSDKDAKLDAEITYKTTDMNWHAEYVAYLNEKENKMDLSAWISLQNKSGMTFNDINLQLVAGNISLVEDEIPEADEFVQTNKRKSVRNCLLVSSQSIFEYYMYCLNQLADINNREIKQIEMFKKQNISYQTVYEIYSDNAKKKHFYPNLVIKFDNTEDNNLGEPLPKGVFMFYSMQDSTYSLIGDKRIDNTPKDEKIELSIGKAFDIKVLETTVKEKSPYGEYNVFNNELEIENLKNEDVEVKIKKYFESNDEILSSSESVSETKNNIYTFSMRLKKGCKSKFKIKYRISKKYIN